MFDSNSAPKMEEIDELCRAIDDVAARISTLTTGLAIDTSQMKTLVSCEHKLRGAVESVLSLYALSGSWNEQGYLSGCTAIVHETGISVRTAKSTLARGQLCNDYEIIGVALAGGFITTDHLSILCPLTDEKYKEHFEDNIELILDNATRLSAQHFSYVVQHWKNMVDALRDETHDAYKGFEQRKLFLSETLDGTWVIQGQLDAITGTILNKALTDIVDKIWHDSSIEQRSEVSNAARRADAIGYLAQGFVTGNDKAESPEDHDHTFSARPALFADVVIDFSEIANNSSTRDFLRSCLSRKTPFASAHSRQVVEQILCDATMSAPIKDVCGQFTLGRAQRVASHHLKRKLALEHNSCFVAGCHVPAKWCDAHHIKHWIHGGETSLDNLVLLCHRHHSVIHSNKVHLKFDGIERTHYPPPLAASG